MKMHKATPLPHLDTISIATYVCTITYKDFVFTKKGKKKSRPSFLRLDLNGVLLLAIKGRKEV